MSSPQDETYRDAPNADGYHVTLRSAAESSPGLPWHPFSDLADAPEAPVLDPGTRLEHVQCEAVIRELMAWRAGASSNAPSELDSRAQSGFENLFQNSPVPLMEQDYTKAIEWMDGLRSQGITDLRSYIGNDLELVRRVAQMIVIVSANPAAEQIIGVERAELLGPIDPAIVNPGAMNGWLTQLETVWAGAQSCKARIDGMRPNGQRFDAETVLAAPVVDGVPDFSRAVFTIMDVSHHMDEERRMQSVIADKSRFLASVSHEIRTPLTAILGFAQVLQQDEALTPDEARSMIDLISQQAQEVTDLVEDLLVAARSEIGEISVSSMAVDLAEALRRVSRGEGLFVGSSLTSTGSPVAAGDPVRIRQIIRNLLTNCARYGGDLVEIEITESGGMLELEVRDDGAGLPRREWERIFEPYHRVHDTTGTPNAVGIGLAVARQLAEMMGGRLTYSHRGGWSRFVLSLPRWTDARESDSPDSARQVRRHFDGPEREIPQL